MAMKTPSQNGHTTVRFSLPAEVAAEHVTVCGDFNDWSTTSHPMRRDNDGHFELALDLADGRDYHYRFLLDDSRWENDWSADAYAPNAYGGEDSVVRL